MTADELIQYLAWALYLLIFVSTMIQAIRRPLRSNIDIAIFFGTSALIILLSVITR